MKNEYFFDTEKENVFSISDLAQIVKGRMWLVCVFVFFAIVICEVLIITISPIYKADALVQIEEKGPGITPVFFEGQDFGSFNMETEVVIATSRRVVEDALSSLDQRAQTSLRMLPLFGPLIYQLPLPDPGWEWLRPYAWNTEKITIGLMEIPEEWHDKEMFLVKGAGENYKVKLPDNRVLEGQTDVLLRDQDTEFSLRVDELVGKPGREFILWYQSLVKATQKMQSMLEAGNAARNARIMKIEFRDESPELARDKLQALLEAYVRQNIARSSASAQKGLEFIQSQLPEAERGLLLSQEALDAYLEEQGSVDLNYETAQLLQQITETENRLNQLILEEKHIESRYTVHHPRYKSLLTTREQLNERLAQLRSETRDLPETQREVLNLNRNVSVAQGFHSQLLSNSQELEMVQASSTGSIEILDNARASNIPVWPVPVQMRIFAALIGTFLSLSLVGYLHFSPKGIRGAEDLEKIGLPVFAIVPRSNDLASQIKKASFKTRKISVLENPFEPTAESLRSLRTAMNFGIMNVSTESVLLTSATPNSGKTFLSVNLSIIAAQAGQKVCLIDADMRQCDVRNYFDKPRTNPGLSDILSRQKILEDVLVRDCGAPGLDIIFSGVFPPNPSELLMRKDFDELMVQLSALYDLIIVDSPPVLAVTDPIIIGRSVSARLVVVQHMKTLSAQIEAVRRTFEVSGNHLTGAVLNNYVARKSEPGYFYNYRYSYSKYGYGYGRGPKKEKTDAA